MKSEILAEFQEKWYFQQVLKEANSMKEAVSRAGEVLRQLLENIPILQVQSNGAEAKSGDWEPDLIARLLVDKRQHLLVCAYKPNGQPRFARSALL